MKAIQLIVGVACIAVAALPGHTYIQQLSAIFCAFIAGVNVTRALTHD